MLQHRRMHSARNN